MLPYVFSGFPYVERFYSYAELDSTNEKAVNFGTTPEHGIFVFQTDRQTTGKGRQGKGFFSNTEGGLWVSILQGIGDISTHFRYNRAISLSIVSAIKSLIPASPLKIKWPNDIYWNNRKLCGILLETHHRKPDTLVIGFGLNVNILHDAFPPEVKSIATSIQHETGRALPLSTLLRTIIECYKSNIEADQSLMHEHYCSYLYRKGSRVQIESVEGVLKTVAQDGHAIIHDGTKLVQVNAGSMLFLDKK